MTSTEPIIVTGITSSPIDVSALTGRAHRADCGAVVSFEGTVRSPNKGFEVVELEYEAYEPIAERQLRELAESAVIQFNLGAVIAVHRIGSVFPGEPAVLVAVSGPHRGETFAGAWWLIDTIKAELVVWKKEITTGAETWVGLDQPSPSSAAAMSIALDNSSGVSTSIRSKRASA